MRERSKSTAIVPTVFDCKAKDGTGKIYDYDDTPYNLRGSYEYMIDEPKTRYVQYGDKVRRRAFKTMSHVTWTSSASTSAAWLQANSSVPPWTEYVGGTQLVQLWAQGGLQQPLDDWAYSHLVSRGLFLPDDYGHYNRWQQIKPTMATRMNLSVFLIELADFRRMWEIIPAKHLIFNTELLPQSQKTWRYLQKLAGGNQQSLAGYVNSQHLNYNFGWKPFLSDIRKCWRGLETFEERLRRFQRGANQQLRKRFRDSPRHITGEEISDPMTFYYSGRYKAVERWDFEEQHASAFDFSYSIPQYSEEEIRWRALADTLGLHLDPLTFWTVLPWSFVEDWFVNVSGMLESFREDWLQPWVKLHQGCYSSSIRGTYSIAAKQHTYGSVELPGIELLFSRYIRKVGLPNFSAVTDPLDADKIRLGSSLLLSLFMR